MINIYMILSPVIFLATYAICNPLFMLLFDWLDHRNDKHYDLKQLHKDNPVPIYSYNFVNGVVNK